MTGLFGWIKRHLGKKKKRQPWSGGPQYMPTETTHRTDPAPSRDDDILSRVLQMQAYQAMSEAFAANKSASSKDEPPSERHQDGPSRSSEPFDKRDLAREESLNGYDSGHSTPSIDPNTSFAYDRYSSSVSTSFSADTSSYSSDDSSTGSDSSGGTCD